MKDREGKKSVHVPEEIHRAIEIWKVESEEINTIEEGVEILLLEGPYMQGVDMPELSMEKIQNYKNSKVEYDKSVKPAPSMEEVELSDLSQDLIDTVEDQVSGGSVGEDHVVQNITLEALRYLKGHREAAKSDFLSDIYPGSKHREDHKKPSWWKCARKGLKTVAEETGKVKAPGKGHAAYEWKG